MCLTESKEVKWENTKPFEVVKVLRSNIIGKKKFRRGLARVENISNFDNL